MLQKSQVAEADPPGLLVHDHGELCVGVQLMGSGQVRSVSVSGGLALSSLPRRLETSEVVYVQSAVGCMVCTQRCAGGP